MPEEYAEFLLCQTFGCLPHELDEIDLEKYLTFLGFMQVERDAERLRRVRGQFYG